MSVAPVLLSPEASALVAAMVAPINALQSVAGARGLEHVEPTDLVADDEVWAEVREAFPLTEEAARLLRFWDEEDSDVEPD